MLFSQPPSVNVMCFLTKVSGQEGIKASKSSLEKGLVWDGCRLGVHCLFTKHGRGVKATWSGKSLLPGGAWVSPLLGSQMATLASTCRCIVDVNTVLFGA